MDWETVLSIGGPKIQARMQLAESAFKELRSHRIADRLKMGAYQVVSGSAERTRVSTYSGNNPLEVPNELLRVLPSFDGRPLDQVLSDIAEQGFELDTRLIRRLMDFQLLVPSEHEEPATEDPSAG
jgi:hypothetical protein